MAGAHEKYVQFPIRHPKIHKHFEDALANFWTYHELDLHRDREDYASLSDQERHFVNMVLAFFAASDGIVAENSVTRFYSDTDIPEARATYSIQSTMEAIHGYTYSILIDTYISGDEEKDRLFRAIETVPAVKKKADWAIKWMNSDAPYAERLLAFVCVEGIQFSGSFCAIYYIKSKNKMPGLCFSNELISRDEGMHTDFAITMYETNGVRLPAEHVHAMFSDAVAIEEEFITESLPCRLLGMSCDMMKEYVRFVADRLLVQLGYDKLYNARQPFGFMEAISLPRKTSFFEARVSEYRKAGAYAGGDVDIHDDF